MKFATYVLPKGLLSFAAVAAISASVAAQIDPQPADSSVASYGIGGAGTGGIAPHLTTNGLPRVGNTGFEIVAEDLVGGSWGLLLYSFAGGDVPLPGIGNLYVQGGTIWPTAFVVDGAPGVAGAGSASIPVPIPYAPALIGYSVYAQGFFVDSAAESGGNVTHSQGLKLTSTYPRMVVGSWWKNLSVGPTAETVISKVVAVPAASPIDGVIAFAQGAISSLDDAAVVLRFSSTGVIDARDGDTYRAVTALPYAAGNTYEFRIVVDVPAQTFDAYVTPLNEAPVQIADGYAFNPAVSPILQVGGMGLRAATGSFEVMEFFSQFHSDYEKVSVKTVYGWVPGVLPNGTVINVTPTPHEGWYGTACIHPDGTDVVFPGAAWGYSRLWKYTFATDEIVPLTPDTYCATQPSYSADGNSIVFMADKDLNNPRFDMFDVGRSRPDNDGFKGGLTGGSSLYVMDADGQNIERITFGDGSIIDKRPSFSPDGTKVVFQSTRAPNPLYTLYMWTVPSDGSAPPTKVLLNGNPWIGRPRYSQDGSEIFFFTGITGGLYDPYGRNTLCRAPAAGGAWTPIPNDTLGQSSHGPDPDPDGAYLWYHAYVSGLWGIYKLPLSGVGSPIRFSHPSFLLLNTAHATAATNGTIAFDSRTYLQFP